MRDPGELGTGPVLLAAGGTVLGAVAVGLIGTAPPGGVVAGLLVALLVGEVLVLTGFGQMWSQARQDGALPLRRGRRPQSFPRALSALAPAGVCGALGALCLGLVVVSVLVGSAVGKAQDRDVVNDTALSGVLLVLMVTGVMLLLGAAQAAVLGAVTAVLVRRSLLARDRRALLESRELARTSGEVAATQGTTTPGRGWRLPGRYAGAVVAGVGLLLLLSGRGVGLVLVLLPVAVLVLRGWRSSRSASIRAVRNRLRSSAGLPAGPDDAPLLAAREAEVRGVAVAQGWTPYAGADDLGGRLTGQLPGARRNAWTGSVDGEAFRVWDRVAYVLVSTNDRPARTTITHASTTVDLDFPMVVRLAVVTDSPLSQVGWSWLGPRIDLESHEFNDRYDVYCDDPVRARLVLNPAVMAVLLDVPDPAVLVLDDGRLTLTLTGTLVPPDRLLDTVRLAQRLRRSSRAAMPRLDGA